MTILLTTHVVHSQELNKKASDWLVRPPATLGSSAVGSPRPRPGETSRADSEPGALGWIRISHRSSACPSVSRAGYLDKFVHPVSTRGSDGILTRLGNDTDSVSRERERMRCVPSGACEHPRPPGPPAWHPQPRCPGASRRPHLPTPPWAALSAEAAGAASMRKGRALEGQEQGAQAPSPRGATSNRRAGWLPQSQWHRRAAPVSDPLATASAAARTPPSLQCMPWVIHSLPPEQRCHSD